MWSLFSLLEDLKPQFSAALGRQVGLAELTIISIQLSPQQALVVTNRNIYLFRRGILRVRANVISIGEIDLIRVVGRDLVLEGAKGILGRLQFNHKKELQVPVYQKLEGLILKKQR